MIEHRDGSLEFRATGENDSDIPIGTVGILEGYSIVFNKKSQKIWDMFYEVIPEDVEIKSDDVLALYSHQTENLLGRESSGTLTLTRDEKGIFSRMYLPDTQSGRDLALLGQRRDIKGQSFGFYTLEEEWDESPKTPVRTVRSMELIEVSAVALPAYKRTTAKIKNTNSLGGINETPEKFQRLIAARRRYNELFAS